MKLFVVFITLLFLSSTGSGQQLYTVKGTVTDSTTGQALGFVSVIFNGSTAMVTTTNAFGKFEFKSKEPVTKIAFSFIGYNTKTIRVNPTADNTTLRVFLLSSQYSLKKVTVKAGENPANRIVKGVIAHRDDNDPDKINSYHYIAYNKFIYSGIPPADLAKRDTSLNGVFKFLEDHYLFVLENVVETEFQKPEKRKEKITGIKMSGIQDPSFTFLSTQVQPLGFYGNFITLLSNEYVNPFSNGSTERYFFNIEDTVYNGKDTIYKLSFRPWKGRKFDGLRGIAEVNSDGYAIQHIIAEPADTVIKIMKVKVEQVYEKTDSGRWFPSKYVTELKFDNALNNGLQLMMMGVTTLSDIRLNPQQDRKTFYGLQVEIMPDATSKNADFWNKNRTDSLTERERTTYQFLDSIGRENNLDAKLKFLEGLINGEIRGKRFNYYISRFLWLNSYEKVRLGLGMRTGDRINRFVSVGGFIGYGFKDKHWKYGGDLRVKVYERNEMYLKFNYWKDLEESGAINFYKESGVFAADLLHNYLVNLFDLAERYQVDLTGRALQYMHYDISAFTVQKSSTGTYRYVKNVNGENAEFSKFQLTGVKFAFRYGYKQKLVQALHNTFFSETRYPILFVQVTKGFNGLLAGQYNYTRLEGAIKYDFKTKSLGDFYLQVAGGYIEGKTPLGELFAGRGSYERIGIYHENTFQTMDLNEFYADRYIAFFYQHDLRTLLIRGKKFQPRPLLVFSALFGDMRHPEQHRYYNFKIPAKGYYEAGLLINDILTKEYLGVARIGIGIGGFYRLGNYSYQKQIDNVSFKASLNATF